MPDVARSFKTLQHKKSANAQEARNSPEKALKEHSACELGVEDKDAERQE